MSRLSWDSYFISIAHQVSTRATCDRKHVGCVLVRDKQIIATGYNGSISGEPHCDEIGHLLMEGHCKRTVHAECNAVAQAAKHGTAVDGATCYVNVQPCWACFKILVNAGVRRIVFSEFYGDKTVIEAAAKCGIEMVKHD